MAVHEKFRFQALDKMFRGTLPLLFDEEMKRVITDCNDRFEEDKPRVVRIEFHVAPREGTHGDEVDVEVEVVSAIPKKRTRLHTLSVRHNGEATFHPDLPDEPDGSTLYDPPEGKDPKRRGS